MNTLRRLGRLSARLSVFPMNRLTAVITPAASRCFVAPSRAFARAQHLQRLSFSSAAESKVIGIGVSRILF
jgi:hypothetical protein